MATLKKDGKPAGITAQQNKEILVLLAQRGKRKDIAAKYHTSEKAISRVRERALTSPVYRASLPKQVQEYLTYWEQVHQKISASSKIPSQNNDSHFDNLAACAKDLVTRLRTLKEAFDEAGLRQNTTIQEMVEGLEDDEDFEMIEFFNSKITRGLLAHLSESEFVPGLNELHSWFDFEVSKISDNFLKMIRLEAALRQFKGKCELCHKIRNAG
jgi:hypothetical protein